ncbi:hypothetical protein N7462_001112 [Penicillium macrosclerotiorum]|uniref:uncharacterized protein n=1 Tax=Penicillium macrosclerotiorum TaxID=303699 RepID=UPI0025474AF8|nr:uncharacterized protein N7462_001112 [Penicillium macrosclerotiorum]KAJ5699107.1 hypothetical protein N7462_001112 [Penicillium macrosclerotiorum]
MASSGTTTAPSVPPSLSLPPSQFARLQPHAYLLAHLSPPSASNQPSIRANGRAPSQFRVTSANAGSLTHTNGSAVVRIGDTAAVCGVRAELLHTEDIASWSVSQATNANKRRRLADSKEDETDADDEDEEDRSHIQDLNLLVPNLSLSTGCAPGFIPGAAPSALAQSLSQQILSLLHSTRLVQADDLRVWYQPPNLGPEEPERHNEEEQMEVDSGKSETPSESKPREIKGFWVLYIDVMMISLAGNAFDAAWASILAALRDTKLPKAWWDVDNETILCSDDVSDCRRLSLRGLPVASSFSVFEADAAAGWRAVVISDTETDDQKHKNSQQKWILADPDGYEEGLSQERACLVVDKENGGRGKLVIVKMEKHGGWTIDRGDLRQLVDISSQRWDEMKRILDQC